MRKILLDEGVPRQLAKALSEFGKDATAFPNEWKQLSDRALLDKAEAFDFGVLITGDKNMRHQQMLAKRRIAVLILATTERNHLYDQVISIASALDRLPPGRFSMLDREGCLIILDDVR